MKRFWAVYAVFVILISCALYVNHSLYKTAAADSDGKIILPFEKGILGYILAQDDRNYRLKSIAFSRKRGFKNYYYYDKKGELLFTGFKNYLCKSGDYYSDGKRVFDINGKVFAKADMAEPVFSDYFLLSYRTKEFYQDEHGFGDNKDLDYNIFDTKQGKTVFPGKIPGYVCFLYGDILYYMKTYDRVPVKDKGRYGLCDFRGNIIVPIEKDFKIVCDFEDIYIYTDDSGQYKLCDRSGKDILKDSYAVFYILGDKLYLNKDRKDIYSHFSVWDYQNASFESYVYYKGKLTKSDTAVVGLCSLPLTFAKKTYYKIYKDGKFGVWDKKGNVIIKPKYDGIDSFTDNVGFTVRKGKYKDDFSPEYYYCGVLNEKGEEIIPFDNIEIKSDIYGMIRVRKHCGTVLITSKPLPGVPGGMPGSAPVSGKGKQTVGKWGLFDNKGHNIIPCEYDNITRTDEYYEVRKGDKSYVCNRYGKILKEGCNNAYFFNNMICYNDGHIQKYYNIRDNRTYGSLEEFIVSENPELKGKNIKVFRNSDCYIIVMGGRK